MPALNSYAVTDRNTGDYLTGVDASGNVKRFSDYAFKNLIINAGMEVSQERGASALAAANAYVVDQWLVTQFLDTGAVTAQQVTDAPAGFAYSLKCTVPTAEATLGASGGEFVVIQTLIEANRIAGLRFGAAGAQSVSLSFWVKAHRTGTYTGSLGNKAGNRWYTFEYTVLVADTWEYKTVVFAGDTSGTWTTDNDFGFKLTLAIALDTTSYGQAAGSWQTRASQTFGTSNQINGVAATNDTFQVTGLCLVPGSVPVPQQAAPNMMRSFQEELQLCQRYYEKSFDYATSPAQNADSAFGQGALVMILTVAGTATNRTPSNLSFKVRKRQSILSVTTYNPAAANAQGRNIDRSADVSVTAIGGTEYGLFGSVTGNATGAIGDRVAIHWTASARM